MKSLSSQSRKTGKFRELCLSLQFDNPKGLVTLGKKVRVVCNILILAKLLILYNAIFHEQLLFRLRHCQKLVDFNFQKGKKNT